MPKDTGAGLIVVFPFDPDLSCDESMQVFSDAELAKSKSGNRR